ncbi:MULTISPECIES: TetR/AcrR family transcriptional regulator [Gordonia]|uniref:TetR/AcrR family transcriptional regulator n=2 Tax=Gordonia TaxID=2053 RepID=A0ABN3HF35_9ACTN|nr:MULTISPECIES: TetR/AcrR family transcriptional regulator [Gordonia]AUH69667.1 TetR/AcrR family transcriptional regulator [Gordonia sp. YC-JH1]KJR09355.1 TetR family transcriptional regulator [Gordonia sihwensis]KXT57495.1 TetR family transcriptional regulator [Gordonia sp. QH-12]MBY4570298.1 TetR family transcriptional regulator [Gordonia sihwensis]WFN93753.1 TetR/AcrR family transcriptional regulator [Gordonia sihwensis]
MNDHVSPRPRSPRGSGDQLAEEIISATTDLLIESGSEEKVSIRAVAGRVGVTPPSIYLHFEDKEALLDAVCARFFEQFDEVMMRASEGIDDLFDRGLAQGLAYVRFAIDSAVMYRITFARVTPPGEPTLTDEVLLSSAFVHFSDTVEEMMDQGLIPRADTVQTVLTLWATAHGLASLMIAKPGLPWGEGYELAESALRAVCNGLGQE